MSRDVFFARTYQIMARRILFIALGTLSTAFSQITLPPDGSLPSVPPGVVGGEGQVVIVPGGGGAPGGSGPGGVGGSAGGVPIDPGDGGLFGGGAGGITDANILVPRGAVAGETVTAIAVVPGDGSTATYQWSITGARAVSGTRSARLEFVADRAGMVSLSVTITANGTGYSPTAQVTIVSSAVAGSITVPPTVSTRDSAITATISGGSGERSFRWSISGDATVIGPRDAASVSFRPGSPGVKDVVCSVNVQNLATIQVRTTILVQGDGPPARVTVNNGSGSATVPAGSRIQVFAHPPAANQVFDRWTGDVDALDDRDAATLSSPQVTLTVPPRPVTLNATYRATAAWTPQTVPAFAGEGVSLLHHIPASARGLIFLLHDNGADAASWFNRPESRLLARYLVAAGFGVAALSSSQRNPAAWSTGSTLATNVDARNHVAALDRLTGPELPRDTPVFFLGLAQGGNAASLISHILSSSPSGSRVRGAVLVHAPTTELLAVTSRVPHLFIVGTPAETAGLLALAEARGNSLLLAGRGVPSENVTMTRAPVFAERFQAIAATAPTFTASDGQTIWQALKQVDILDPNGYVRDVPSQAELEQLLPVALRPRASDIAAQLAIANARPELSSLEGPRIAGFLNARLAGSPSPDPGRVANISTRSRIAFLGDTFQLGFNLSGNAPATLLIRGIGAGLARFGLASGLPAARLELRRGETLLSVNERWDTTDPTGLNAAAASVGAFPLMTGDADTALLIDLAPGTYVASLLGLGGATGEILVEVYDVSRNSTRLTNLSTLSKIHAEGEVLVPGIVVTGTQPRTLLARAVGPGLAALGFSSTDLLGDPRLTVLNQSGALVDSNQNWTSAGTAALNAVFPLVGAFPLQANSPDAASITALQPGNYTLQVAATTFVPLPGAQASASPSNPIGTVLVEIYEVP